MKRKRMTQMFPWLTPIRIKQRRFFFYLGMRLDNRSYCKTRQEEPLPILMFTSSSSLYNQNTGFDMTYQENKVYNLKLAAAAINNMVIRPNETFSFSQATRHADSVMPYKHALAVLDGKLTTTYGGGLCQITNLLFWLFLHSPLMIVERHGHEVKEFPEPVNDLPIGVDATIYEGWLDLKVQNNTDQTYQINIDFNCEYMVGRLFTTSSDGFTYEIENRNLVYDQQANKIIEEVDVIQKQCIKDGDCVAIKTLYRNRCEIGYALSEDIPIQRKDKNYE